ncbi:MULTISPECIES: DUF202 domain-containing protein [unclassified Pseudomonas]|uniref:DUF202 domain-containing protein n=1 Tax=unclassified Pseudomonas TaxID=196821 RepID=UPI000D396B0B|nr:MULTISPECIES: DUF202 domain-containing protein [unclassified Pseudomonas]RAU47937.1 DUF202 domain-containing protein [Pseudomonas sp. RIT 409]RAU55369.1 DUF202 domain-containing protein [Pseudomonas sp. RIT 412]
MSPIAPMHHDIGLQPERTLLAWRRTLLSLLAASALFLRWVPHHGPFAFAMTSLASLAALGIWLGQLRRYHRHAQGINYNRLSPAVGEVLALGLICVALGCGGICVALKL